MIATKLIDEEVMPLHPTDTGAEALHAMADFHVRHLPVVDEGLYIGTLCEQVVFRESADETLAWTLATLPRPYVAPDDHIFTVLERMYANQLTTIPVVVEPEHLYKGVVTLSNVLSYFGETTSMIEPGAVIVLEMSRHQYSMFHIARIVEGEGMGILSSFVTSKPNSTEIEVTLKLNQTDVRRVTAAFVRHDYDIKASFDQDEYVDTLRENYDSLMVYLNV